MQAIKLQVAVSGEWVILSPSTKAQSRIFQGNPGIVIPFPLPVVVQGTYKNTSHFPSVLVPTSPN